MERGTFQDSAAKLFNALPANIGNSVVISKYTEKVNAYLLNSICKIVCKLHMELYYYY